MRDYNFFSSIETKGGSGKKQNVVMVGAIAGLAIVAVICLLLFGVQMLLKWSISSSNAYLMANNPKSSDLVIMQNKIEIIKKYSAYINAITNDIGGIDKINKDLLDKINSAMPRATYILNVTMKEDGIDLKVISDNKSKASELVHNMKALDIFKEVNLGSVSNEAAPATGIKINVICKYKDVVAK